jgi:RNA polymerase sigma factor (sigma-70 family)
MTHDPRRLDDEEIRAQTRSMRSLARGLLGCEHGADDAVQDAWVTALDRPPEPRWRLGKWLAGVTRNHARQQRRAEERRSRRERRAAGTGSYDEAEAIERLDLLRHVLEHVRGLEEPYGSTLVKRYLEGRSSRSIARELGLPDATVRTRLRRGLEQIRARLDREHDGQRQAWAGLLLPFALPHWQSAPLIEGAREALTSATKVTMASTPKIAAIGIGALAIGLAVWGSFSGPEATEDPLGSVPVITASDSPGKGAAIGSEGKVDRQRAVREKKSGAEGKAGEAALEKKGSWIQVRHELRLVGTVRSVQGAPIEGADVSLAAKSRSKTEIAKEGASARSAEDGGFELEFALERWVNTEAEADATGKDVAAGPFDVELSARAEGFARLRKPVRVDPRGGEARVDFELQPALILTGRVVARGGKGVANATVGSYSRAGFSSTKTDAEGRFRFSDLQTGIQRIWLFARAEGYFERGMELPIEEETARSGIEIAVVPAARVKGRVFGSGRLPLAGAVVTLEGGKVASQPKAETDEEGRYELSAVVAGRTTLVVTHEEHAPASKELVITEQGGEQRADFFLTQGRVLAGVLRSAAGPVIEGGQVAVYFEGRELGKAKSDEQGRFEIEGLPAREISLWVMADGHLPKLQRISQTGQRNLQLLLQRSARLAGQVFDERSGQPVTEFRVRLRRVGAWAPGEGKSESGGAFFGRGMSFASAEGNWDTGDLPLAEGSVLDVIVTARGFAPTRVAGVEARSDPKPHELRIGLGAGVTLRGRVVGQSTGVPVEGAELRVASEDSPVRMGGRGKGGGGRVVRTDAKGAFELRGLSTGSCGSSFSIRSGGSGAWRFGSPRASAAGSSSSSCGRPVGWPAMSAMPKGTRVSIPHSH